MVILDFTSPLVPVPLDVRGNAAHWFIRTAEAATNRTIFNWQGKFSSQEEWDTLCATPAANAWSSYLRPGGTTKRGLSVELAKAKHAKHFRDAWQKALSNWDYAFREEGDKFFEKLQTAVPHYEKATQDYLGYMGLHIQEWLGSIAVHIMLLCGNREAGKWIANRVKVGVITFPDPPIIAVNVRVFLNQELMTVLARDLYRSMPQPDIGAINQLLDVILGAFLGSSYAAPPFSFLHLEHVSGFHQLHSHIRSLYEVKPPVALPWHVPYSQPVPLPGFVALVPDLFAYGVPGDLPLASLTLTLANEETNYPIPKLYVVPSDLSLAPQPLDAHIPTTVMLPVMGGGVVWQLILQRAPLSGVKLVGYASGSFIVIDTAGTASEPATWLIQGSAPTAQPFTAGMQVIDASLLPAAIVSDIVRYAVPGDFPLATISIALTIQIGNFEGVSLFLSRTDSGMSDIELSAHMFTAFSVAVPPGGVLLQLIVQAFGTTSLHVPVIFGGSFWCTDVTGVESNHAQWTVAIT